MKKLLSTISIVLICSVAIAQSYQQMGNTLQRRIIGPDTSYRFNMGSPGNMYVLSRAQTIGLIQSGGSLDSALRLNKNLYDVPDKTVARNNLGVTSLLALKANDNAVVHITGTETITGIKSLTPTLTATANGQTLTALTVTPTNVTGGFSNLKFNGFLVNGTILGSDFRGADQTILGSGASGIATIGTANRARIITGGSAPAVTVFDSGLGADTYLRTAHAGTSINIADYGRLMIGGSSTFAIGVNGSVTARGTSFNQSIQPQHNADTLTAIYLNPVYKTGDGIDTYDTLVGGSGYTDGSYTNVLCINGTGDFARASVTVSGGSITSVTITSGGAGYVVGDIVNFANATIGVGGGLSAHFRVASLVQYTGSINRVIKSPSTEASEFGGDIEVTTIGKGIILKSPDGTRYRITAANGGTLTVTAL